MNAFLGLQLPVFMPDATSGAVRTLTTKQLTDTGTKMVVVNTFHLLLSYGEEALKMLGGIGSQMDWNGNVLSDSGGFQVYSLIHRNPGVGKVTQHGAFFRSPRDGQHMQLTPEGSIDMQVAIGSDVLIVLDDCRHSEINRKEAELSVANTTRWAYRAKEHFMKKYPRESSEKKLFAVIQGGGYEDLREKSATELVKLDFDGYCFGGWPVDTNGVLVDEILGYTADLLPDDKPKYAMGVGNPWDIEKCYHMGYTLFDCVIPTRNARHGQLFTRDGILRITASQYKRDVSPVDDECGCETCTRYSRAYLHHLFKARESTAKTLATIHNVTYYQQYVGRMRDA